MSATGTSISPSSTRGRTAVTIILAAVAAVVLNELVAMLALTLGANPTFPPLAPFVFAPFTLLGLAAAYIGWRIIRRRANRPARVLRVLVPILTVLSFIPDTFLAITGFIPGSSLIAVLGLATMHLVVVGTAVVMSARVAPVR